jgi:hypothetical protein
MKKFFTILCLTVITSIALYSTADAQNYKNAIGGRFGTANGITFKTSLGDNKMLDLIANFRSKNNFSYFRVTGLYEINMPIAGAPGLGWYYGIGGTLGSVRYKYNGFRGDSDLYASLDGVLGLDYKFVDAPINLSLDWKPAIQLTPDTEFDGSGVAISIRYTF